MLAWARAQAERRRSGQKGEWRQHRAPLTRRFCFGRGPLGRVCRATMATASTAGSEREGAPSQAVMCMCAERFSHRHLLWWICRRRQRTKRAEAAIAALVAIVRRAAPAARQQPWPERPSVAPPRRSGSRHRPAGRTLARHIGRGQQFELGARSSASDTHTHTHLRWCTTRGGPCPASTARAGLRPNTPLFGGLHTILGGLRRMISLDGRHLGERCSRHRQT